MARIRSIKPEFWVDDALVELDFVTRLLFIGIWNFVDDEGFIEYTPKRIKMQVFPADALEVSGMLRSLLESNQLTEYASDQGSLLKVTNWERHQKISHATATRFTGIEPVFSGTVRKIPDRSGLKGIEGNREKTSSTGVDDFEEFWKLYPRRVGKQAALKAYKAALKKTDAAEILAGVERYKASVKDSEQKFIAHPTTWLNAGRWCDELPTRKVDPDWALRL